MYHLKSFSTDQFRVVNRSMQEHWQIQRSRVRACSALQISMLRAKQTEGFVEFVADLVRLYFSQTIPFVDSNWQADLYTVFETAQVLELNTFVTDTDLSLIQEVVALATGYPELAAQWGDAITFVCRMMDHRQSEWFAFERLYPEALEAAMLEGTEEDPIVIVD
jgi:predicted SnoaL-like aldol condensation-catalyzing enzyme